MTHSLNVIKIEHPCDADWDAMTGDDRQRHCASCDLNVVNLDPLTDNQVGQLMARRPKRLCVRHTAAAVTLAAAVGLSAGCEQEVTEATVIGAAPVAQVKPGPRPGAVAPLVPVMLGDVEPLEVMGEIRGGRMALPPMPLAEGEEVEPIDLEVLEQLVRHDRPLSAWLEGKPLTVTDYRGSVYPAALDTPCYGTRLRVEEDGRTRTVWLLPASVDVAGFDWIATDGPAGWIAYERPV